MKTINRASSSILSVFKKSTLPLLGLLTLFFLGSCNSVSSEPKSEEVQCVSQPCCEEFLIPAGQVINNSMNADQEIFLENSQPCFDGVNVPIPSVSTRDIGGGGGQERRYLDYPIKMGSFFEPQIVKEMPNKSILEGVLFVNTNQDIAQTAPNGLHDIGGGGAPRPFMAERMSIGGNGQFPPRAKVVEFSAGKSSVDVLSAQLTEPKLIFSSSEIGGGANGQPAPRSFVI
ncbi:MAG: hypothetical protein U0X58_11370 [Flavobacteriaceae bacterium]